MLISHMEGRPEWPLIVQSVVCPVCKAGQDLPCVSMGAMPGTLAASTPRNDWHQERKEIAVREWNAFRNNVGAHEPIVADGSGSERYTDFVDTGFAGEGDPYGIKEYTEQAPQSVDYVGADGLTDAQREETHV